MPADPQVVGEHLDRLRERGDCSAGAILESAKPSDSPIHCLYEWDVEKAAEAHWLQVSRSIPKRLVEVRCEVSESEPVRVTPAFAHVPPKDGRRGQGQYLAPAVLTVDEWDRALCAFRRQVDALEAALMALAEACDEPGVLADLEEAVSRARIAASVL